MPDFDFENLDSRNFERLACALCNEYVARGIHIFGSGTDGGREATFEGKMRYSTGAKQWDGYLVVQCKQKESRGTPKQEAAWAIGQLDAEMDKYRTAKKKRRIPDYFLFITNAHFSAQLGTGGKDKFLARLRYWVDELGMKDATVWDRDKLNNWVDITPKVAQRFGLLHHGDIISYIARDILAHRESVDTTLSLFLQEELRTDQFVNLAQAGHISDDRTPLARVFVDLRAVDAITKGDSFHVVQVVQQASDGPLHPTLLEQELTDQSKAYLRSRARKQKMIAKVAEAGEEFNEQEFDEQIGLKQSWAQTLGSVGIHSLWTYPSRFVIIGGPGQGKSTLAQHLAQRHRAALLRANSEKALEPETERIVRAVEEGAVAIGAHLPTHPRWPFRVILEQFASALAKGEVQSVLEYIAALIRKRTGREFTQHDAEALLTHSAWLVVFDGLDEVPAVSNRGQVLDVVRRFLLEAREKDADLLVLATTRPQGYQADFNQHNFNHLHLQLFKPDAALAYAQKFVEARYADEADRRERIMQRLQAAAQEEAIARLMQSPLQVTIMAALVDLVGNPPRERYQLFQRYYEIIYQREQERGLALSDVLAHYRTGIEILHDRVGLLLQVEAETKGKTESRISRQRLEQLVRDYLVAEEHTDEELARTTANFMDVALHRLVFIVPLEDERYGFEVRSLQEFSAARALMRDGYDAVKERLRAIAPIPYWRNTVLFAIGQAFSTQNTPFCDMVMQLCRELNENDNPLLYCTLAGSRLALDVLEDGIVEWRPGYRRLFIEAALELLALPHEATALRLINFYTDRDEARYLKAAQAAVGSIRAEALMGLFLALATLQRDEGVVWAGELLQKSWPQQLELEQPLLAQLYRYFARNEWFNATSARVAAASGVEWVQDYMGQGTGTTVPWLRDARQLRTDYEVDVSLKSEGEAFRYSVNLPYIKKEVLDRLQKANLTHYEWLPFTLGQAFFLEPSPETLAALLETLVHSGAWQPDLEYEALPWQLFALLTYSESPEELLHHAQRARLGELGTAMDWQLAEKRWRTHPFTEADLATFSDAEWPYSGKIAGSGFIPMHYFGLKHIRGTQRKAAAALLRVFHAVPSHRYKSNVASAFFYVINNSIEPDGGFPVPLAELEELVSTAKWQVTGGAILTLLEPALDWVEELKRLDAIGERISVLGNTENQVVISYSPAEAVAQLLPLVGTKRVREGILRLLATQAVAGASVPVPAVDPALLSAEGQVALVMLNLLSTEPTLAPAELARLAKSLWQHKHPRTGAQEMVRILNRLFEREKYAYPLAVIETLEGLYAASSVQLKTKVSIIEHLIIQLEYRTSGLADPARNKVLDTEWLVKVLKQ